MTLVRRGKALAVAVVIVWVASVLICRRVTLVHPSFSVDFGTSVAPRLLPPTCRKPSNAAVLAECDQLCEQYDANPSEELCVRLRVCGLPCGEEQNWMDAVYLWANGSDPVFTQFLSQTKRNLDQDSWLGCLEYSVASKRAREMGTLRFSVRALVKNVPFIRRIFIVTPLCQVPMWLDTSHPRIRVIDTRDVLPGNIVSFNSNAVQLYLDTIPTLSNPFLAMNDDFIVLKPTNLEHYFDEKKAVYWLEKVPAKLINGCFGAMVGRSTMFAETLYNGTLDYHVAAHQPLVVLKDVARFIRKTWPKEVEEIRNHPVRHPKDITFDSFHIWIGSYLNKGVSKMMADECFGVHGLTDNTHVGTTMNNLFSPPLCKALALNDDFDSVPNPETLSNIDVALYSLFPNRTDMEKDNLIVTDTFVFFSCHGSGERMRLPIDAFRVPPGVAENLYFPVSKRKRLRRSKFAEAVNEIQLEYVDIGNSIAKLPKELKDTFRVTFASLKRGANWCEFGLNILKDDVLKNSDVIFATGMDFGMQRSLEGYHARRLGHLMGMNYAFGVEYVNLNTGSFEEQKMFFNPNDQWGLIGNAIFSRWEMKGALDRLSMCESCFKNGAEFAGEELLGGPMVMWAWVMVNNHNVSLGLMRSLTDLEHDVMLEKIKPRIQSPMILVGEFPRTICEKLELQIFTGKVERTRLKPQCSCSVFCGLGFNHDELVVLPNVYQQERTKKIESISDSHVFSLGLTIAGSDTAPKSQSAGQT